MRSLFKTTLLSVLLLTSSNAKDLLDLATNGAISQGDVKTLNNSEMKNVKGGYLVYSDVIERLNIGITIAIPNDAFELGAYRDEESKKLLYLYPDATRGLCGYNENKCYENDATFSHYEKNKMRLLQYAQALGEYKLSEGFLLAFIVKRNIGVSNLGKKYTYFTYQTAAYNLKDATIHPISSSANLENPIVKELRDHTQLNLEKQLGGLKIY